MAGRSGYGGTLTIVYGGTGSTVVSTDLGRWSFSVTGATIDTSGLGDTIEQVVPGSAAVVLEAERVVRHQSGMAWTGTLGAYDGSDLESVNVNLSIDEIETGDASDYYDVKLPGVLSATVEYVARKATTQHFCTLAETAATTGASVALTVVDGNGTTVIGGNAYVTMGSSENPRGANRQSGRAQLVTVSALHAQYPLAKAVKETWSSNVTHVFTLKDDTGATMLKGSGYAFGGGMSAGRNAQVRETLRAGINVPSTIA